MRRLKRHGLRHHYLLFPAQLLGPDLRSALASLTPCWAWLINRRTWGRCMLWYHEPPRNMNMVDVQRCFDGSAEEQWGDHPAWLCNMAETATTTGSYKWCGKMQRSTAQYYNIYIWGLTRLGNRWSEEITGLYCTPESGFRINRSPRGRLTRQQICPSQETRPSLTRLFSKY